MCVAGDVWGVTQLHDVVYLVCWASSTVFSVQPLTISRFSYTTHQRLADIDATDLRVPFDIVACELTSRVYVADSNCVWRMSPDSEAIKRWLPKSSADTFTPSTLSVTSTRLLVTSLATHQLRQFDADGDELRRVQLPDHMDPLHAVESPTGTFVVSLDNGQLEQCQIVEVNTGGEVLHQFSGSRLTSLGFTPQHVAVDSHGNVFVADHDNSRILLLDDHLSLRRVIVDEHQLNYKRPRRLCYREQSGRLLVGLGDVRYGGLALFHVLCHS